MKSLRISALTLALAAFAVCSLPTFAQQEVDPDHFEQPAAVSQKASSHQKAAAQHHSNAKLASKRSHKTHHHANA